MADYINKNILCETYLHLTRDLEHISQAELEEIKSKLLEFTKKRAALFLYSDVEVSIEFRSGSLKAYITVTAALYAGIADLAGKLAIWD